MHELAREMQGNTSCLVLRLQEEDKPDRLAMGMLENNRISGLLPVNKRWEKQNYALYYTISSLTPLQNCTALYGDERRMTQFLRSFCGLLQECEEYLLDRDGLLLNPEHVFVKAATGDIGVVYVPLLNRKPGPTAEEFLKEVTRNAARQLPPESPLIHLLLLQGVQEEFVPEAMLTALDHLQGPKQPQRQPPKQVRNEPVQKPRPEPEQTAAPVQPPVYQQKVHSEPVKTPQVPQAPEPSKHGLFDFGGKKAKKEKAEKPRKKQARLSAGEDFDNPFADQGKIKPKGPEPAQREDPPQPQPRKYKGISVLFGSSAGQDCAGFDNPFTAAKTSARQEAAPVRREPAPMSAEPTPAPAPRPQTAPGAAGYTINLQEDGPVQGTISMGTPQPTEKPHEPGTFPVVWLEEQTTGNRIRITHSNFHVGRKISGDDIVDYAVMTATPYMGSDHCYFLCKENRIYLVDNNSFNGTWVDGRRISPGAEVPLQNGAVIRMADVVFTFRDH